MLRTVCLKSAETQSLAATIWLFGPSQPGLAGETRCSFCLGGASSCQTNFLQHSNWGKCFKQCGGTTEGRVPFLLTATVGGPVFRSLFEQLKSQRSDHERQHWQVPTHGSLCGPPKNGSQWDLPSQKQTNRTCAGILRRPFRTTKLLDNSKAADVAFQFLVAVLCKPKASSSKLAIRFVLGARFHHLWTQRRATLPPPPEVLGLTQTVSRHLCSHRIFLWVLKGCCSW